MAAMQMKLTFKTVVWFIAGVVVLALLAGLALYLLDSTTFTLAADRQGVTTETELGQSVCTKRLTAEFPFFSLECRPRGPTPSSHGG